MPRLSRRAFGTLALCVAAFGAVIVGCNSYKRVEPNQLGSMTVTVNAADGTTPSVIVTGPNSYTKTITGTQTLTNLVVGSYTIVADSAVGPDSVVGTNVDTGTVTGSPSTVVNATTSTVTVSYAMKHHVGGLWVANNESTTIVEFASNQLRVTGSPTPAETLATIAGSAGLALDSNGNMWEASNSGDSLAMYTPAARNTGGKPTPSRTVVSTAIQNAENIAFDAHGNLWVANCGSENLIEFTASQLASGGTQTPSVTIGGALGCATTLAFDSSGGVWVGGVCTNRIVKFSAAQLVVTGTPAPVDTIVTQGGSLFSPVALTFDANGDLWVANDGQTTVVEYTPAQLIAGGAPLANAIITLPDGTEPFGLAFDKRGTLWVSDVANGIMYGLTSPQLAATGTPTPAVALTVTMGGTFQPQQPLFDPYATATGIVATARLGHPVAPLSRHAVNYHHANVARRNSPPVNAQRIAGRSR